MGVFLRKVKEAVGYLTDRKQIYNETKKCIRGRYGLHQRIEHKFVSRSKDNAFSELTGLMFPGDKNATEELGLEFGYLTQTASYVVGNVWLANRVTPDGHIVNHVVVTLIQKRGVRFKVDGDAVTVAEDSFFVPDKTLSEERGDNHIVFRGGCTLIFDLDTLRLRYAIKKDIDDRERMVRQFKYENGMLDDDSQTYFDSKTMNALAGPFAFMHSHTEQK